MGNISNMGNGTTKENENLSLGMRFANPQEMINLLSTLSYDYEAIFVVDLEEETMGTFRCAPRMYNEFDLEKIHPYNAIIFDLIDNLVLPEYREDFAKFLELDSLKEIIKEQKCFKYRYAIKPDYGKGNIYEMSLIRVEDDSQCHLLVAGAKCIDDILKLEREEMQLNTALLEDCVFYYEFDVTEGVIDGHFKSGKGYDPLFDLKFEFPMSYDEFNRIRTDELGLACATEEENEFWTCEGLIKAFNEGKRSVNFRYGSERLVLYWTASVILTEDITSNHIRAVYICKDVTSLVIAQMRQKKELQEALSYAQNASVAKTNFLSRMSHDIRTPLNGIIGLLEINENHKDDKELVDANRKKAMIAANHLLSLINDVLDMSKLESDETSLPNEPMNIVDVCSDIYTISSVRARESNIEYTYDGGVNLRYPNIYGSPLHFKQLIMNLVSNAIKYNKPGGSVRLLCNTISSDENFVTYEFIVKDTGIGMKPEFLERLYMPFTQEKNDARSRYQGTGMGMSIVKALVDKMDGKIQCYSAVGEGTTFVVTIPFEINHASEMIDLYALAEESGSIDGMRILLVEDNELNMEIAEMILEDAGAIITKATNGLEACEIFENERAGSFDAILMDIMMPKLDGYAATMRIRNSNKDDATDIPIIAMTANAFAEDVQNAKSAGMNEHLAKPIQSDILIKTLGKYKNMSSYF